MKFLLLLLLVIIAPEQSLGDRIPVYFGTEGGESRGIYRATFDTESGELGKPELAAEIRNPGFLALSPDGGHLYAAAMLDEPVVAAYSISTDGSLAYLNAVPIGDGGAAHISVHPSGKCLMTAQYGGGSVAIFPISADGKVEARSQLVEHEGASGVVADRQESPHPHWTGYSPDGDYAFVPDLGLDQVLIYRIDPASATLRTHGHADSVPGGGPRHMRFSSDGRFIYLLNELTLSISTLAYDSSSGTASMVSTEPTLTESQKSRQPFNSASEILVHPSGNFVYSANRGDDSITLYDVDRPSGKLTARDVENIRGAFPRNINLDPSGRWLLAAGQHSDTISVFSIHQETGVLTHRVGSNIPVPGPICIVFRPGIPD